MGTGVLLGSSAASVGVGEAIGTGVLVRVGRGVLLGNKVSVGVSVNVGVIVGVRVAVGGMVGVRLAIGCAVGTAVITWATAVGVDAAPGNVAEKESSEAGCPQAVSNLSVSRIAIVRNMMVT